MIILLKLGGSLITNKSVPHCPQIEIIKRIAKEIAEAFCYDKSLQLIIGHGSGSFGHIPAKKYGTRIGVHSEEEWRGFAAVHAEAFALNQIVTETLRAEDLPCISFSPLNSILTSDGKVIRWDTSSLFEAMNNGLIPIIYGDTVFDEQRGGTILSTEDLFVTLCESNPVRPVILLAGLEEGVWGDFPARTSLIRTINANDNGDTSFIGKSAFIDVTGGMEEKVHLMRSLILDGKAERIQIFSGIQTGNIRKAISGENVGTMIV